MILGAYDLIHENLTYDLLLNANFSGDWNWNEKFKS